MKKILVIDGNSIINRAFYGIRSLSTSAGKPTNAIYGMINIVSRQLEALKPDYVAAAFDLHTPTFRKVMYPDYKEGRHPTPPELLEQFDDAKECLRHMGVKTLELVGYEADDIQGTIARWAHNGDGFYSYILSGDRDLLQLIDEKTSVLLATNNDTLLFDTSAFVEKYGVEPPYLVDTKALMGDSSDNIPGVAGIGEKTAFKLISQFGSLDGIYENISSPDIAAKVREKLTAGRDSAYLCYKLAKIVTDAPVNVTLEDIAYTGMDKAGLYKKFRELEFNALIKKFALSPSDASASKESTAEKAEQAEEKVCRKCECASFENLDDVAAFVSRVGDSFAVAIQDGTVYISSDNGLFCHCGLQKELAVIFAEGKTVICYDSKKLWHTLNSAGIALHSACDLMLYEYTLNSTSANKSLQNLCVFYEDVQADSELDVLPYMKSIHEKLKSKAKESSCLELIEKVELPLAIVLAEIEATGFCIDVEGMSEFSGELEAAIKETEEKIYMLAGLSFNINSPKQLSQVLTEELGIALKKKTKSGFSTDVEALEQVRYCHPIIDEILEYRKLTKLHSTYAVGLLRAADSEGRIHTDFRQALTATGRLSSTEPNLQNIPIKTSLGKRIRAQFKAKEDYVLVDADYSQIELRLLACMSGDEVMTDAFRSGADIHARTASAVFGIPEYAINEEYRKRAKAVNFGIVYGIGAYSLSSDLKISMSQAKQYIESYFAKYPRIKEYLDASVEGACRDGYTVTLFGRRRYIPELQSSRHQIKELGRRIAMNSPIQGTAADVMKIATLNVAQRLKKDKLDAKIVMQVHDELVIEAHKNCAEAVKIAVTEEMQNAVSLSVPLTVDATVSNRWYE